MEAVQEADIVQIYNDIMICIHDFTCIYTIGIVFGHIWTMLSCHIPQILSCIVMSMYCQGLTCCEVAVKQHGFCLRSNCWAWSFCAASPLASPTSLFSALIDMP